jgi:tetratricopeptide (TPR) repeat protein
VTPAVNCDKCGAKRRLDRDRCPRCRAYLAIPDPAQAVASSRRLARAAAVVAGAFALILIGLWVLRDAPPRASVARSVAAPLPPSVETRAALPPSAAPDAAERPFVDPAGKGSLAYAAGDYAASLAQYQEAVEKNPQDAESLSNLGQVLVRLNRTAEAVPYFERAVAILPGRWAYHFNLARALGLLGRTDDAIAGYRRAQQLFPNDYATAFNLGMTLHHKGDEAAAVEQYQKAIALLPEDASFRMALGISYERLQKGPEAAAAYQEYLRLSPAAPDAEKVRARIAHLQSGASAAPPAQTAAVAGEPQRP